MSVNVVNKSTGALTKVAGNAITEASGINYSHTTSGMSATNVQDAIDESYSSLKSGLTDLSDHVDGDATTYPYADVITINDAVPANLADCKVKVEPVQDLHGYDKPWVGGAGKNKLPLVLADIKTINTVGTWNGNIYTHRSATVEVLTDNADNVLGFKVNGTPTGGRLWFRLVPNTFDIESNTILNGCPSGGWYNTYCISILDSNDSGTLYSDTGSSGATINNSAENVNVYIRIEEGYTASNLMFYPMIRLATETDATFAPYTNICPISGHTEAVVTRDGKNRLPLYTPNSVTSNGVTATLNADGSITFSGTATSNTSFSIKNNGSLNDNVYASNTKVLDLDADSYYTISKYNDSGKLRILVLAAETPAQSVISDFINENSGSFNGHPSYKIIMRVNSGTTINETVKLQLEKGSTATAYEPYKGQQYTLALGDTIYGGTVDFDSGVMTVDRGFKEYEGAVSENWRIEKVLTDVVRAVIPLTAHTTVLNMCNCLPYNTSYEGEFEHFYIYNNILYLFFYKSRGISDVETLKAFLQDNHVQICYRMKATTIQLSPQQIQLLQGTNTLYASTGDISVSVNGVSGAIGAVQEQANATDNALAQLAADIAEQLPDAPTTDGAYVLTVTVADGAATYSWGSAT